MLSDNISERITIPFNITASERNIGDCRTKAFKQIFDHYGFDYSIQEIFGVGMGVAFSTVECKYGNIPLISIEGRNFKAESEFCKYAGVECKEHFFEKNDNILNEEIPFNLEILKYIELGNPVLVQCDVFYMDYLNRISKTHNEYHVITIIGFDKVRKTLSVVDSLLNEVKEISMSELYNAMFSKQYSIEKRAVWYSVSRVDSKKLTLCSDIHKQAINDLGKRFIAENGDLYELKEFVAFTERILSKAKNNSSNHIQYLDYLVNGVCYIVRQQDELNGSCFRSLYLRYLNDLKENYPDLDLSDIITFLEGSEEVWRKIAYKLRYSKDDIVVKTQQMIDYLDCIYEYELNAANAMAIL